ncbi:G5 and 3D domain-containing protein [Alkalihalobacterium chitinilyticum]|uniref:Ubiquitin-like domain-containing protein n=1 Tax=Alkalihalobacterium chitinilyticum TaxID=2980103 RepID=A0ABT5VKM8_9BACI|nr:G5 and 3D domain-containing protein [Alkalihalobacterium chitinilyticum]MDE5416005.1 ubiquitin-like domain-containing protein [Alkalihalobacterium chitinilyticum]
MEPSRISSLFSNLNFGKKLTISILCFVLVIGTMSFAIYETTKANVTVTADEEEVTIRTHANTVAEVMEELGYVVGEYDELEPAISEKITGNMSISWKIAKEINVAINGDEKQVWTTADSVEDLIAQLDITVKEHDKISPSLNTEIQPEMNVTYESAFMVRVTSDGEEHEVWTTSTTVADFLEKESITLGELDRVEPALEDILNTEEEIKVVRVEKVTDVVEETVAFATVTKNDSSLQKGKEKVVDSGQSGLVEKHYEVVLEDGKEVSRELIKTETTRESKDRVVAVGTRQPTPTVSRGSSPTQTSTSQSSPSQSSPSGKTLRVSATAYTANCSGCSGITATGINLKNNRNMKVIAVDPNVIPLGSRVHVEGYGTAIAGDTGGAIRGNKIDVHVPTKADAFNWGRRTVTITILD